MFSFAKKLKDRLEGAGSMTIAEADTYFASNLNINNGGYALRVLYVAPESIACEKGFEAWFDYIVGVNGHHLPMKHPQSFVEDSSNHNNHGMQGFEGLVDFDLLAQALTMAAASPEKQISVHVWNAKGGIMRQIQLPLHPPTSTAEVGHTTEIVHTEDDSTTQTKKSAFNLFENRFEELGLTLTSQHLSSATHVWRILNTHPNSPAFEAQLVPYSDYIIGCESIEASETTEKGLLAGGGESLLPRVLSEYYNRHYGTSKDTKVPILLYVYNHDLDTLRPVTVRLTRDWTPFQDKGLLGCEVGYGLLHRLPVVPGKYEHEGTETSSGSNFVAPVAASHPVQGVSSFEQEHAYGVPQISQLPKVPSKGVLSNRYVPKSVIQDKVEKKSENHIELEDHVVEETPQIQSDLAGSQSLEDGETVPFEAEETQPSMIIEDGALSLEGNANQAETAPEIVRKEDEPGVLLIADPTADTSPFSGNELVLNIEPENKELHGLAKESTAPGPGPGPGPEPEPIPSASLAAQFERSLDLDDDLLDNQSDDVPYENEHAVLPEEIRNHGSIDTLVKDLAPATPEIGSKSNASASPVIAQDVFNVSPIMQTSEKLTPANLEKVKSFESLLDADEDFLDHLQEPVISKPTETDRQPETTLDENCLTEISLGEVVINETEFNAQAPLGIRISPSPPIPVISTPESHLFSPMNAQSSAKTGLSPQAPKPGRRRKTHGTASLGSLAEFMNEELTKSKANDTQYETTNKEGELKGIPPPPTRSIKR